MTLPRLLCGARYGDRHRAPRYLDPTQFQIQQADARCTLRAEHRGLCSAPFYGGYLTWSKDDQGRT